MSWFMTVISSRETIRWLTVLGAVGAVAFVALYALRSPGWWRSPTGAIVMGLTGALAGLLVLVVATRYVGSPPIWVWTGGMATLDLAIWALVIVLWRKQRDQRRGRHEKRRRS